MTKKELKTLAPAYKVIAVNSGNVAGQKKMGIWDGETRIGFVRGIVSGEDTGTVLVSPYFTRKDKAVKFPGESYRALPLNKTSIKTVIARHKAQG
jgi:hypothetical protein